MAAGPADSNRSDDAKGVTTPFAVQAAVTRPESSTREGPKIMSTDVTPASAAVRRTTAFAGLAAFLLAAVGQTLTQVGGGEPPFDAPASDIAHFFANRDETLFPV